MIQSSTLSERPTGVRFLLETIQVVTQQRLRKLLFASLLALYGVTSLFGPALHSLPGADHVEHRVSSQSDAPGQPVNGHDDCPICHFLAQGQILSDDFDGLLVEVVQLRPVQDAPAVCAPPIDRPSAPRAPPIS